jgi:hypothetical protein
MRLRQILNEATTAWVGSLDNELGNGKAYTLNYGTGAPGRPNMLYIPVPLSLVRSAARKYRKSTGNKLTHVGEAHVTVSMGPELSEALGEDPVRILIDAKLFDSSGNGIAVPVKHTGDYKILNAPYYKDDADPDGPSLVAEVVEVPLLESMRTLLGLSPLPQIGARQYIPHITIGYMANLNKIHQSYVEKYGSSPR